MTWNAYHRRDTVTRDAMAIAESRRDGVLAWSDIPDAEATFGTPDKLVAALQMRWHTRLSGAVERELAEQPWDL
ncbi:MAG: hypothetical protein GEU96_14940, partial [Propionibacteriales bacterium]|nr:hypothetical protein [Propionibacteriales bacterium]